MSDFARVDSIDALRDFRAALWKFSEVAQVALGDAESELSRTQMWLENEQTAYWATQIRKRQAIVTAAAEKLREKKIFKDASGRVPSAVDEEKALKVAKAKLEQAEEKQLAVKKYIRVIQKTLHDYKGSVQGFQTAIAHDVPLAVARLDRLAGLLRQYVDLAAPGAAGEPAAAASGEPMSRAAAPDGAVLDAGAATEDLPDFPAFEPPHVVLVHMHLPTGLILGTDAKSPAEDGMQYRPFASIIEAERYARQKVETDPLIECRIYGHDKAKLMSISREKSATPAT
jgi:hypothetical protein